MTYKCEAAASTVSAEDAADIVIQKLKKKGFDVISRENIVADIEAIREWEKTEVASTKKRRYNYYRSGRHEATTKERAWASRGRALEEKSAVAPDQGGV